MANKLDLLEQDGSPSAIEDQTLINISAKTSAGLDELIQSITHILHLDEREPQFSARIRHTQALSKCLEMIETGLIDFEEHQSGELLAEDLRLSQLFLSEITGDLSADDLLGKIFSGFCIGK